MLSILLIKYVSDKFAGQPYGAIKVPRGSSFANLVALKGKTDIGDQINKKIIAPLATANKLGGFTISLMKAAVRSAKLLAHFAYDWL